MIDGEARRLAEAGAIVVDRSEYPKLKSAWGLPAYATADAFGEQRFPIRVARLTRELGRKTARDGDPRARVDTRVLEVIARFDAAPAIACRSACA